MKNQKLWMKLMGVLVIQLLGLQNGGLIAIAQTQGLRLVVNTNQDGPDQPDGKLSLREAIAIVNGTLPLTKLSQSTLAQITVNHDDQYPNRIDFNLPPDQTTIYLNDVLPPLNHSVVIDGTTQPGYDVNSLKQSSNFSIPQPIISLAPAPGHEVFRGLTVIASGIKIRGLDLSGFTAHHRATATTPPADIFIANRTWYIVDDSFSSIVNQSPQDVVVEDNYLGIPRSEQTPLPNPINSAFGVFVFDSVGTKIVHNRIANHDGSGIITGQRSTNLLISENLIEGNGFRGMSDAIRLEGDISNTQIRANQIQNNAGSGIYIFKATGATEIKENIINDNGKLFRRAAIFLMGNNHQVMNNQISNQPGPGVVVGAYPPSDRNIIIRNRFAHLDGLTIDLVTQQNTDVHTYEIGDGRNPRMNSYQQRRKTGNFGVDTPKFSSKEFFINEGSVTLIGTASPGVEIEIDREVDEGLSEPIGTVITNNKGKFTIKLTNLQPGERVSAIATDPQHGTSEPALSAVIKKIDLATR